MRVTVLRNAVLPSSKRRLIAWLALLSLLFGVIEFGNPVDLTLRTLRNKIRAQPVSGEIVVVGIDDKALSSVGPWPWNRSHLADITKRAFDAGARRVFFDILFQPLEPRGDQQLAEMFARYPGKVFIAGTVDFSANPATGQPILPTPRIAAHAETVSVMRWVNYLGGVTRLPYRKRIGSEVFRSAESAISGVEGSLDEEFPIDYSFQASSVPYVSAADILSEPRRTAMVRGKDVFIAINSRTLADVFALPGQGRTTSAFLVALGAETLKNGKPLSVGWFPAWVCALGITIYFMCGRRRPLALFAGVAGVIALLAVPLALEYFNVFVDVAPALFLCATAMLVRAWQSFGALKRSQGSINPVSGLKTANAILQEGTTNANVIVAVRLRRFTDIVSALPPEAERELIGQIVSRLSMGAGQSDLLHGDDGNFFWLLPPEELALVVDRFKALQLIFRNPIRVADRYFDLDVFFGVDREVHMPLSHRLASALAAAHAAGEEGGCWRIHDPSAMGAKEWALSLLGELDQAIDAGHIWVAYQPKMELATGRIVGAEALVRWTHATRGPIDPAEFVEMAERHGRIDRLTAFVLNEAARSAASARRYDPRFAISVNISPRLLGSRDIVDMVAEALRRHGLPGSGLVLEITETAAVAEGNAAVSLLEELRTLGAALSIDDYGTGMSTLDYLRRIPATELKVDKQFAASLVSSVKDQVVMRSTIELAHTLGLIVVAEGVETAETLEMLRAMGCEVGQGYHIGHPMEWILLMDIFRKPEEQAVDG